MIYDITSYGAIADGQTLNSAAIQRTIDAASAAEGGRVVVPPGNFLTGTLTLRSQVIFEVQPGAILQGSPRMEDYTATTDPDGDRTGWHLLQAHGEENVTLCGGGIIDGNGPAFWAAAPHKNTWLLHKKNQRPSPMVDFRECRNIRVENLEFRNAPGWTVHFHHCDTVWTRGIKIDNPLFGPNTDGIDISGCTDVMISDCYISAADDAIVAFPSHTRDCRRVTVTNCTLRSNCVAFKAYLFPTRSVYDLVFSNSTVFESNRALGLYGFGAGMIENVLMSNVICDTNCQVTFTRPIHIDAMVRENFGSTIRNIQVSNFVCRTDGRILITGAPGATLENIVLRDVRLSYPVLDDPQLYGQRIGRSGDQSSGWALDARVATAAVVAEGVNNLVVDNLMIDWPTGKKVDWISTERAGNGTHDMFPAPPAVAPAFHALWGRRLSGGYLHMPLAHSSQAGIADIDLEDSDITSR